MFGKTEYAFLQWDLFSTSSVSSKITLDPPHHNFPPTCGCHANLGVNKHCASDLLQKKLFPIKLLTWEYSEKYKLLWTYPLPRGQHTVPTKGLSHPHQMWRSLCNQLTDHGVTNSGWINRPLCEGQTTQVLRQICLLMNKIEQTWQHVSGETGLCTKINVVVICSQLLVVI